MDRYSEGWTKLTWPAPPPNPTGMFEPSVAELAKWKADRNRREARNLRRRERRKAASSLPTQP
jgi:hypothetical protein